jgi:hypothetical protein
MIRTRPTSKEYRVNFDAVFGPKSEEPCQHTLVHSSGDVWACSTCDEIFSSGAASLFDEEVDG